MCSSGSSPTLFAGRGACVGTVARVSATCVFGFVPFRRQQFITVTFTVMGLNQDRPMRFRVSSLRGCARNEIYSPHLNSQSGDAGHHMSLCCPTSCFPTACGVPLIYYEGNVLRKKTQSLIPVMFRLTVNSLRRRNPVRAPPLSRSAGGSATARSIDLPADYAY